MYAMWKRKEGRREVKKTVRRGGEEENVERSEISSSHGGEYEAQNLLGCTTVFLTECRRTFQRYVPLKRRSTFN
jgi:hypothetical protein